MSSPACLATSIAGPSVGGSDANGPRARAGTDTPVSAEFGPVGNPTLLPDAQAEAMERLAPDALELEEVPIQPKKTDISVNQICLAWQPTVVPAGHGSVK